MDTKTEYDFIITIPDKNGNYITKRLPKGTATKKMFKLINDAYNGNGVNKLQ